MFSFFPLFNFATPSEAQSGFEATLKNMQEITTDKRQHLLQVAELLFAQQGYEAVSVRHLAKEAGVNLAMISYYFGSKEGLFAALIENKIPRTRERLEAIAQMNIDPWEKISQTIDVYVDNMMSNHQFSRVIIREMSIHQRPENVRLIIDQVSKNMKIIRGFIEEGQKNGQFKQVDNELTLASFFGTLSTVVHNGGLICQLIDANNDETVVQQPFKDRVRAHVKSLLKGHLIA